MDRIERSGRLGMWLRALEAGAQMKRQTGASWPQMIRSARAMTAHGAMPLRQAMMAATMPMLIQKALVDGDIENGVDGDRCGGRPHIRDPELPGARRPHRRRSARPPGRPRRASRVDTSRMTGSLPCR